MPCAHVFKGYCDQCSKPYKIVASGYIPKDVEEPPRVAIDKILQLLNEMKRIPKNDLEKRSLKIKAQNEIIDNLIDRVKRI